MKKIIKDIRYYGPINNNKSLTDNTYLIPTSYNFIGIRYSLKLREFEYYLDDYDHLYIYLDSTSNLNESTMQKKDNYHPWFRRVNYGYSIEKMNNLNDTTKLEEINKITRNVLIKYCCDSDEDVKKVENVYNKIKEKGELLDILYKILKSGKKEVKFILNILDNGEVNVFAECEELYPTRILVKKFDNMSIVNCALGSIKIKNNMFIIIPKKNLDSEYYKLKEIKIVF